MFIFRLLRCLFPLLLHIPYTYMLETRPPAGFLKPISPRTGFTVKQYRQDLHIQEHASPRSTFQDNVVLNLNFRLCYAVV